VLDALFPLGRQSRRFVRMLFQAFHPADWLGSAWILWLVRLWTYMYARLVRRLLRVAYQVLGPRQAN